MSNIHFDRSQSCWLLLNLPPSTLFLRGDWISGQPTFQLAESCMSSIQYSLFLVSVLMMINQITRTSKYDFSALCLHWWFDQTCSEQCLFFFLLVLPYFLMYSMFVSVFTVTRCPQVGRTFDSSRHHEAHMILYAGHYLAICPLSVVISAVMLIRLSWECGCRMIVLWCIYYNIALSLQIHLFQLFDCVAMDKMRTFAQKLDRVCILSHLQVTAQPSTTIIN